MMLLVSWLVSIVEKQPHK